MNTIKVPKAELIAVVRKNRDKHREVYELAMNGYQKAAGDWLAERLQQAREGKLRDPLTFREPVPEDHTSDYDRILAMLDMSIDEVTEIEEHDFAQYALDEWGWKRQWLATASNYTAV